jgi:hypothetical protein
MAKPKHPVKVKPPPRLSTVRPPQDDVDPGNVKLQGDDISARLAAAITDMQVEQTIEGASTLSITVADDSGALLRSQLLAGAVTVTFDGLAWQLVKTSKGDRSMTLVFEERAVSLLRLYSKPKKADRATTTRAQFVRSLITEVTQARIPYEIPEVNVKQPIAAK